ncbi:ABC transporter ATP-binding protein [Tabrizicola sp.]|uniref:ABC transporter ATP-binding protein n=1 Tax=Tabrizicola sp. TaxID=2005166 RepID=UPI00286ACE44|nr:ABC transporter ATP-binding protein [Tabrizicola sp.]
MISIRNVSKTFGRVQAVRDVSLDIRAGEFFSLLGASGSGKTTLLRMLAGFEGVTSGTILIDGQEMQDSPPHLRPVNMVFQNYAIFPHLNVRDNIAYGLRRLSVPSAKQAEMVDEMLEMIALPGYGDRRATQLSGGQMQRVALARALILKPKVLLLDEPLGALDKQLREQMQLELRALQKKLGITFVLVTHDQEEALTLSDRIAVMSQGAVLQVDTPAGLYERPRNKAIASFIGNMNFFDATVSRMGPPAVDIPGFGRMMLNGHDNGRPDGSAALVAIRPEKLTLHAAPPAMAALKGVLQTRQYLGGREMLHVGIAGRAAPIAVALQGDQDEATASLSQGHPVWLTWKDDALLVLDAE